MNPRTTHSALLALGLTATIAAVPAAAHADTFCVQAPCASPPAATFKSLDLALAAAANTAARDRIEIGEGALTDINATVAKDNLVDIVGSGADTKLIGAPDAGHPVIAVKEPASRVSDLTVRLGAGASGGGIALSGAEAKRVQVEDTTGATPTVSGTGVTLSAGSRLAESSVVRSVPAVTAVAASAMPGNDATVEQSSISGPTGLLATGTGIVWARQLNVFESSRAVMSQTVGGVLRLSDSLVEANIGQNPVALAAVNDAPNLEAKLEVARVTAVSKTPFSTAVLSSGQADGGSASVQVHSSVFHLFSNSLVRSAADKSEASINVQYSDFDDTKIQGKGPGATATSANQNVDPGFVGSNDYQLSATSPLIDRADPSPLKFFDSDLDLAFKPRHVDGDGDGTVRSDIGAYEYQPAAATVDPGAEPGQPQPQGQQPQAQSAQPARPVTPQAAPAVAGPVLSRASLSRTTVRHGARGVVKLRFRLSKAAKVQFTVQRRVRGTWRGVRIRDARIRGAAGPNSVALTGDRRPSRLAAGSYRARLVARDAGAKPSNTITLPFRVQG